MAPSISPSLPDQAACELAVAIATGADEKNGVDSSLGSWTTYNNNFKDVDAFNVAVEKITKDNLYDIVIKRDAFHTVEEVYANIPPGPVARRMT